MPWKRDFRRLESAPLDPQSFRLLVASAIGVLIWIIWVTGTLGDSHHVTMLALSAVSILGLGLVLELRKRFVVEVALQHAKAEAEKANRSKSEFIATMSHELRTPLNSIIGFSEIIKADMLGPIGNDAYRSYVNDIRASGSHLLQVVNDIIDLTRAEVGKFELCDDEIEVAEVVHAIARLSRASIEKAGLTIAIDVPQALPLLRADERRTRQILFNLIGNAAKFTPRGGHIAISGSFDPALGIEIIVADTGIGIAPKNLARVLEPFVQIDSELSRQHVGTGLGLPAVKAIMEQHGGRLEISSELGSGTQAKAIFPPERAVPVPPVAAATALPAA